MTTELCPKVLDKIRPRQLASCGYQVCRFGPCEFEVNTGTSTYLVIINGRLSECVCQTFRHTGLPCSHMLASCGDKWHGTNFHTLCDNWYFSEVYRNAYSLQFHPVPDKRLWSSHEEPAILPPALRKKKGRPKSTRICNSMDARETISTTKRKCKQCNEVSHYKKKCPQLHKNPNRAHQVRGNLYFFIFLFQILINYMTCNYFSFEFK
jgi:SWIM zinc finger